MRDLPLPDPTHRTRRQHPRWEHDDNTPTISTKATTTSSHPISAANHGSRSTAAIQPSGFFHPKAQGWGHSALNTPLHLHQTPLGALQEGGQKGGLGGGLLVLQSQMFLQCTSGNNQAAERTPQPFPLLNPTFPSLFPPSSSPSFFFPPFLFRSSFFLKLWLSESERTKGI